MKSLVDGHGSQKRADIQGLRAVAVLLVVAFHAGLPLRGGFVGVDMFFVISGFVIASLLLRELERTGGMSFSAFYTRRMRRLLPALAVLIVVVQVSSTLLLSPFGPQQATTKTSLAASLFAANIQLASASGSGYFDLVSEANAQLHTWSLSVEEQFYLVFPAFLLLACRSGARFKARGADRQVTAILVAIATVGSFALSWYASYGSPSRDALMGTRFAFYSSATRAWEFGIGVLLALAAPALGRLSQRLASALSAAGVALVVVGVVTITASLPFPGFASLLPVFGTALILAAGTATTRGFTSVLGARPAVWIGDVSYGWYLWHWPLIVFATALWPGKSLVLVVAAIGSLVPTWLSYNFIENPIRFNDRLTGRRMISLVVVCVAVPIASCAGLWLIYQVEIRAAAVKELSAATRYHGEGLSPCGGAMGLGRGTTTYCAGSLDHPSGTIVLVGDSNAGQFVEPVAEAARQLGLRLKIATMGGCPFADLIRESQPESDFYGPVCYRFVQESIAALTTSPPALVIMAMSSSQFLDDRWSFSDPGSGKIAISPESKAKVLERALTSVIDRFAKAGIPTVIIHPIPHLGNVAQGLATFNLSGNKDLHTDLWNLVRSRDD